MRFLAFRKNMPIALMVLVCISVIVSAQTNLTNETDATQALPQQPPNPEPVKTDLAAVSQLIKELNNNETRINEILNEARLPLPACTPDQEEIVPHRQRFRWPILEEFFAQKMNETLPKLNGNPIRVVIISTWKKVCGLAYLSRHAVQEIEARLGSAV